MTVLVGTSGWQYRHWRGVFYPEGLPQRLWLAYFADRFPTVEVNNTFYNLPREDTFRSWRTATPEGFVIGVKASRYITHVRRLRDCADPVGLLWSRAVLLGERLGPVLFQLPPTLRVDAERLASFLATLPPGMRAAFEFRHRSWETARVRTALDRAGCALVLADRPGTRVRPMVTGGWSYVRFHQGSPAGPDYSREKLRRWADRIAALPAREVFVYFNNDPGGAAVRDAATLSRLLERRGADVRGPRL